MQQTVTIQCPAKLNLVLNLLGPRPDGFHEVQFVMLKLPALYDELQLQADPALDQLYLTSDRADMASPDNLLHQAYTVFYAACPTLTPLGLRLHLHKVIPTQAGLGGGSSNAASLLCWLNAWHDYPLSRIELEKAGASLGSDVPFFMGEAVIARATGRGNIIEPLNLTCPYPWLIIKPKDAHMPTPLAYQGIRERQHYQTLSLEPMLAALKQQDQPAIENAMFNDFEPVVTEALPILGYSAEGMRQLGIKRPLLCGSGSALAGMLPASGLFTDEASRLFPSHLFHTFYA